MLRACLSGETTGLTWLCRPDPNLLLRDRGAGVCRAEQRMKQDGWRRGKRDVQKKVFFNSS